MKIRVIRVLSFALLVAFCSCNHSKQASKKRRKQAPCDCPKFNYAPQTAHVYYADAFNTLNSQLSTLN